MWGREELTECRLELLNLTVDPRDKMDKMGKIDIDKFDTPSAHHGRWFLAGGRDRPASALHWDNSTYVHMYIHTCIQ